jgi:hypothetical protein
MGSLTYRQSLFVYYFLGECKGNASQAAIKAGYTSNRNSAGVRATRLLKMPRIQAAIQAELAAIAMSQAEVLARYTELARADLGEIIAIDAGGQIAINLPKLRRQGKAHLIKKVRSGKYGLEVELHDSMAALYVLARYHGMIREAPRESALTPEELEAMIQGDQACDQDDAVIDPHDPPPPPSEPEVQRTFEPDKGKAPPSRPALRHQEERPRRSYEHENEGGYDD